MTVQNLTKFTRKYSAREITIAVKVLVDILAIQKKEEFEAIDPKIEFNPTQIKRLQNQLANHSKSMSKQLSLKEVRMSWDCKFDNKALKDLQKITPLQQKRILQAITVLSKDPYIKNNKIKRLAGSLSGYYRLRIGNFRVLYLIDQDMRIVFVKAILPRNEKTYQ